MKVRESRHARFHTFHLCGDIDMHHAPALRALLAGKAERRCPALLLDLSGVEFIDSTGISVLLEYLRAATKFNGQFCLAGVSDQLCDVFKIVQLERALPIFKEVAKAESALATGSVPPPSAPLFGPEHEHAWAA